jgi:hypothetical protein
MTFPNRLQGRAVDLSIHCPFALLACAFAVIILGQTLSTLDQRSALEETHTALANALFHQELDGFSSMTWSRDLITELQMLSETDADAKQIIGKWNKFMLDFMSVMDSDDDVRQFVSEYFIREPGHRLTFVEHGSHVIVVH